jgi:hypothetical protein
MIGFATRQGFRHGTSIRRSWFIQVANGSLIVSGPHFFSKMKRRGYGIPIPNGSVVTAIHDRTQQHIEFLVGGKSLGIAFTSVKRDELFATVEIYGNLMAKVRIVENA